MVRSYTLRSSAQTHWLQWTVRLSQAAFGPAVLIVVSSEQPVGQESLRKSVSRGGERHALTFTELPFLLAHMFSQVYPHHSHTQKPWGQCTKNQRLKVLNVPSPQDLCWTSAALSLCSAPDTGCVCHCTALRVVCFFLKTVSLFLDFCTMRTGLCVSLRVSLRWL